MSSGLIPQIRMFLANLTGLIYGRISSLAGNRISSLAGNRIFGLAGYRISKNGRITGTV